MGIHSLPNTKTINMPAAAAAPKVKKAAAHPKYSVMIAAAITALKDRTGSSRAAILKHVVANNKVDAAKAATQVRLSLKRGVAKGALKMAAAKGKNAGSYKLVKVVKPKKVKKVKKVVKKKAAKKPKAAKKVAKKAKKPAAKKAAKKPAKKAAPKKKPAAKKAPKKKAAPKEK